VKQEDVTEAQIHPGREITTAIERVIVFTLAATSIGCLLAEFYGWMSMRAFTLCVFGPASVGLLAWGLIDRAHPRGGRVWRMIWIGAVAGLFAAFAYDVFRLPFVFSRQLELSSVVPPLPLFKVFPQFGRMILLDRSEGLSLADHLVGWAYHFSNGITFGIMYMALIGPAQARRRSWAWGIVMAVGIEIGMLVTPYAKSFGIPVTGTFIAVTLAAHAVFGAVMGLLAKQLSLQPAPGNPPACAR